MLGKILNPPRILVPICHRCGVPFLTKLYYGTNLESKYSDAQKEKILHVLNNSEVNEISRYDITKARIKKLSQWKTNNKQAKFISDIELIEGFTEKTAKKLFDSILEGPAKDVNVNNKIKGQILHPNLSANVIKKCKSVLSVYCSVSSVCWTLIEKDSYEVVEWNYYGIDYPDGKRLQITDILNIAWRIVTQLPIADIYVMKAEATTLRAAGSDPNNPKVLGVNLQKAQMVSMIVALINARNSRLDGTDSGDSDASSENKVLNQKVYFLRPTLPYRLYGTLVGNEKVSTAQTVEMLLQEYSEKSANNSHVFVPEPLKSMFRSQKDLQMDMLGHCLLLALTFMDLCIYRNQERIAKLIKAGE